jgi:capsular exopolysaccharide synthesis family protein
MMSEGKTTLSCHLATSLARAGHRTLLVDTDIRRPTVHRVFELPCEPGICEVLRGEVPLADAIVPTPQDGLFLLPAGRLTQEALRELAQDALNPIMAQLREDYDFIIVDSSPILPVTDSLLVSQYVDGVIFSIRRDVSQYPKVATACQRLAMIGIPLWGAVVIGLDQTSYGYRYAYQYGATAST